MADNNLMTLDEASGLLRLKVSTLRAWVLRRRIPYVKVGRLVRVRRADIERLIAASVVPARDPEGTAWLAWRATHEDGGLGCAAVSPADLAAMESTSNAEDLRAIVERVVLADRATKEEVPS